MFKAVLMATLLATGLRVSAGEPQVTTLVFVNAGEMEVSTSTDANLSTTGQEQANQLVSSLDGMDISAIYTTFVNRAVETVTPLAKARMKQLDYFKLTDDPEQAASVFNDLIKRNKGKTIVICSDPENITAMIYRTGLRGKEIKTLYDKGCGHVLIVKQSSNNAPVAQKLNMNIQKKV
ncbi:histidine phosphatase family protein [Chitinophaga eiseniae]|uniref:Broad specificity phosphatase PhoE n=1 Tax=Chitinophaga eiseniae TaxID=634771 RepID=A0A847SL24_9BACT|nr:histidine phosphatase family protein [Chitinophaga eiseniae]NLR77839.1 hypothetical protein [Chitinophaga eiseniae]